VGCGMITSKVEMHIPVLERELIDQLNFLKSGQVAIDCTLGEGGHADGLLASNADVSIVGIERDGLLAKKTKERLVEKYGGRIKVVNDNYANLKIILSRLRLLASGKVGAIYFDLGACLWHYKKSGRGFSFKSDEPLDMRFNNTDARSATDIINDFSKEELVSVFCDYGEVRFARNIVDGIHKHRKSQKIEKTQELIEIIFKAISRKPEIVKNKEVRKVFQALRIATNNEFGAMISGIEQAIEVLDPGGRIMVITYHSTEDRMVKRFFAENDSVVNVIKKPIQPSLMEKRFNISSRSAKLRIVEKQPNK
jgi:16S rRNA (cytosine1402-N4)-methyltransferase